MTRFKIAALSAFLAAAALVSPAPAGPLGYSGGTVTQNFDTLPTNATNASQIGLPKTAFYLNPAVTNLTDMTGWQGNNQLGSSSTTEFRSHDGSLSGSGGRGLLSYGTNGSSERALGALPTSNQINRFGLVLQNTSADTYSSFQLSYTGEQWRRGDDGSSTMTFAHGLAGNIDASLTSVAGLSFISPNVQVSPLNVALNGNLSVNQVGVSGSVSGFLWAPGQTLVLSWTTSEATGQDNGLGIDNLSFAAQVPEPSTLVLSGLAIVGLASYGFRRRRCRL